MTKLDEKAVALSMGISAGAIYIICVVFVALLPLQMILAIDNMLLHSIDVSALATKSGTLGQAAVGVLLWFVIASGAGYLFAALYNRISKA